MDATRLAMKRQRMSPDRRHRPADTNGRVTTLRSRATSRDETPPDLPALLDALPQVVFRIDGRGYWSWLSAGWSRLTGFEASESLGQACREFVHPADRPRFDQQIAALQAGLDQESVLRARFVYGDGQPRWMELHISRSDGDRNAASLVGTLSNITNRVAEENQRRAAQRTLTSLINDLPGMVYRCRNNRDWTMEYVSRGARELTGYDPEDLINNHMLSYASLINPDDNERVWDEVQLAVNAGQPFDLVYRIVTAGQELKWVWERGRGIVTTSGELLGLEGFITDITRDRVDREALGQGALYEAATGLPTANLFIDRVNMALRRRDAGTAAPPVLLVVHLDRFSRLARDGQAVEQYASRAVAATIAGVLAGNDTMARLRDDRFMVLLDRDDGRTGAVHAARAIRDALRTPVPVNDHELYLTASIGIAVDAGDAGSADQLLCTALQAVNQARALGGDRFHFHDGPARGDTP